MDNGAGSYAYMLETSLIQSNSFSSVCWPKPELLILSVWYTTCAQMLFEEENKNGLQWTRKTVECSQARDSDVGAVVWLQRVRASCMAVLRQPDNLHIPSCCCLVVCSDGAHRIATSIAN